jgi:hypothetical protein
MAKKYVESRPTQIINILYRVKPKRYFDDIQKHSSGVMIPYLKDNSGHLASPINRKIKVSFLQGVYSVFEIPELININSPCLGPFFPWLHTKRIASKHISVWRHPFYNKCAESIRS